MGHYHGLQEIETEGQNAVGLTLIEDSFIVDNGIVTGTCTEF